MCVSIFLSWCRVYTWPAIHSGFLCSHLVPLSMRLLLFATILSRCPCCYYQNCHCHQDCCQFPSSQLLIVSDIRHYQARTCTALEAIQIVARSTLGTTIGWYQEKLCSPWPKIPGACPAVLPCTPSSSRWALSLPAAKLAQLVQWVCRWSPTCGTLHSHVWHPIHLRFCQPFP